MVAEVVHSPSKAEEPEKKSDPQIAVDTYFAALRAASAEREKQLLSITESSARFRLHALQSDFRRLQLRWHGHLRMLLSAESEDLQQSIACELTRL